MISYIICYMLCNKVLYLVMEVIQSSWEGGNYRIRTIHVNLFIKLKLHPAKNYSKY